MRFRAIVLWSFTGALALHGTACKRTAPPSAPASPPAAPSLPSSPVTEWPDTARAEIIPIEPTPARPLTDLVVEQLAAAKTPPRKVLIYVGAPWCEPCRRFHTALVAGALNPAFPGVRFLELDSDRHAQALRAAGCQSDLIPLFAVPTADGRCSDKQIQGGIKGDGAVGEIVARLRPLLAP